MAWTPTPYEGFTTWFIQFSLLLDDSFTEEALFTSDDQEEFPGVFRCPDVDSAFAQPITYAQNMVAMPPTFYNVDDYGSNLAAQAQEGHPANLGRIYPDNVLFWDTPHGPGPREQRGQPRSRPSPASTTAC